MGKTVLEFQNISKLYPGVVALDDVSISFCEGEVHALVGENGAGKSTLIKTCTGAIKPSSGKVRINGQEFSSLTPITSKENGIGAVYQELNLVNELTVAENVFLGNTIKKGWIIDRETMEDKCQKVFEKLNIDINPSAYVKDLTIGFQQMVELAKALVRDARILILDEPTAPLTAVEINAMFRVIRQLKSEGVSIIYISHRLDEIFELADRVSVLRDGKLIKTCNINETSRDLLIKDMVGRSLEEKYPERMKHTCFQDDILLEAKNLSGNGITDVSFCLRRGEILGLGGLIGAGRTELIQLIYGYCPITSGELLLRGKHFKPKNPMDAIKSGIALVPEDRKQQGVLLHMSIADNICMPILRQLSRLSIIKKKEADSIVQSYLKKLRIKAPNAQQFARNLSGGNQQKVVIAKALASSTEIVLFDEPTRGIDVGAKHEIYELMCQLCEEGKTIIMISSEMEELMGMADRVLVMSEGRMVGEVLKQDYSQERILSLASNIIN